MRIILSFILLLLFVKLEAKIIYTEPVRNATLVNIENNIIIGFDNEINNTDLTGLFSVKGSVSGVHEGKVFLTSDRKRMIFKPNISFTFNETVEVELKGIKTSDAKDGSMKYSFHTQTIKPDWNPANSFAIETGNIPYNEFSNNSDTLDLPSLTVNVSNDPSPGNLYLSNFPFTPIPHTRYLLVADNNAALSYYKRIDFIWALDFKKQINGMLTYGTNEKFYAQDMQHNLIDSFACGNGYSTDHHELLITEYGHALLMSYDPQTVDMSLIVPGGNPNATVIGLVIQELDENKNVVFQWRSWDHIAITDAVHEDLTAATIDYVHGNAIELDNDGNIMISSRHLSEITKINRATGNIMWRLGGIHNQFTFINDAIGFSYQHDIRRIANGNITLFDNGNYHPTPFSRAVEYRLDEINKTATQVWQYRSTPDIFAFAMGSAQRLKNGNTLISWGSANPTIKEVTPSGTVALEMTLAPGIYTYRTFRDEMYLDLNIKLAIEGFYKPLTGRSVNDTVRAYARSFAPPYNILDSSSSIVDSISLTGKFRFENIMKGMYYICIEHRNSLQTWSRSGGELLVTDGTYNYDFTNFPSSAFGNNLALKGTKYCIYSGDVNKDGNIDLSDILLISNDASKFVTGYVNTDVDGNYISDLSDEIITYNNSSKFITVMNP